MPVFKALRRTPRTTFIVAAVILAVLAGGFQGLRYLYRHHSVYPSAQDNARAPMGISRINPGLKDRVDFYGWGPAQASVQILDKKEILAEAVADKKGQWTASFPAGKRGQIQILSLQYQEKDRQISDIGNVVLFIPGRVTDGLYMWDKTSLRLLEAPLPEEGDLSLILASQRDEQSPVFSGRGTPDAPVQLYADNQLIGSARTDAKGFWTLVSVLDRSRKPVDLRLDGIQDSKVTERYAYRLEWAEGKSAWLPEFGESDKEPILIFKPGSGKAMDAEDNIPGQIIPANPPKKGLFR